METKNYKRLSLKERVIIETLLNEKRKKNYIAIQLNRSRSTISREINNWVKRPGDRYNASLAHWYAQDDNNSKRLQDKITMYPRLKIAVFRGLLNHLSPEIIAGRLKLAYPNDPTMHISYESIYRYIYAHPQGKINIKLIKLLTRHKSRRRKPKPKSERQRIAGRVSIEQRPASVETRTELGHWEGDLMIGSNQNSFLGTLVERKIRYTILVKLPDKKSETVTNAFANSIYKVPEYMKKTLTYDNGSEMAKHKSFSLQTGMDVYFAHPYSSWERGTNENTNGLIRRFYPKGADFNKLASKELESMQNWLNNRPRKVLGYYTPSEMLLYEKAKYEQHSLDDIGLKMGNKSQKDLFSFLMPVL